MPNLSIYRGKLHKIFVKTCGYLDTQGKVIKFYEIVSDNDESMGNYLQIDHRY